MSQSHRPTSNRWIAAAAAWSIAGLSSSTAFAAASLPSLPAAALDLPAVWEVTWPFLTLAVVALVAATYGLIRLRERQTRRRLQELERLLELRSADLSAAYYQLELLDDSDSLTGVANRRTFDDALRMELRRASRGQGESSLLLLDIDGFKAYNDAYGHEAGNQCLRRVAQALDRVVGRAGDLVARFDGDEFAMLLPSTDHRGTSILAERACRAIETLAIPHAGSSSGSVTISVGAASLFALRGHGAEVLISCAEEALSRAKTAGGNRSANDQVADAQPALRLVATAKG